MNENNNRRRNTLLVIAAIIAILILLLLTRCPAPKPAPAPRETPPTSSAPTPTPEPTTKAPSAPAPELAAEVLTPATLKGPERVTAGAAFAVAWTGPDNRGDYLTIVRPDAPANEHGHFKETKDGPSLELTAPIDPGHYEVRYITVRSHTILGRAPIEVVAAAATLNAPAQVVLGSNFSVTWTGPNNAGDYITIVAKGAPDDHYGNYTNTDKGSPLTLTAPTDTGDAEIRYVSGQGRKVLGRAPIKVVAAEISLSAPAETIAGSTIDVIWTGPNNPGDYITIVPKETPDGNYGNYLDTAKGTPLKLVTPIMTGIAELRYMTSQGRRVLARREITIKAAEITLAAPPECKADTEISITWTGPNHPGDYITVVAKGTPDGQYAGYANTSSGSPLKVKAPKEPGDAEIRYASAQGNKVLARIPIKIVP